MTNIVVALLIIISFVPSMMAGYKVLQGSSAEKPTQQVTPSITPVESSEFPVATIKPGIRGRDDDKSEDKEDD